MKQLTLIRHAKSSWKDAYLLDIDRPLKKRGKRDAPTMGKRLAERESSPDLLWSDPKSLPARSSKLEPDPAHGADALVTGNRRHYPRKPEVPVLSPRELAEQARI